MRGPAMHAGGLSRFFVMGRRGREVRTHSHHSSEGQSLYRLISKTWKNYTLFSNTVSNKEKKKTHLCFPLSIPPESILLFFSITIWRTSNLLFAEPRLTFFARHHDQSCPGEINIHADFGLGDWKLFGGELLRCGLQGDIEQEKRRLNTGASSSFQLRGKGPSQPGSGGQESQRSEEGRDRRDGTETGGQYGGGWGRAWGRQNVILTST